MFLQEPPVLTEQMNEELNKYIKLSLGKNGRFVDEVLILDPRGSEKMVGRSNCDYRKLRFYRREVEPYYHRNAGVSVFWIDI